MIAEAIVKIVDKQDLTYQESYDTMNEIMSGDTTPTQNAAFLAALSTKSAKAETTEEISGCAQAMRDHAQAVNYDGDVLEIVGTGGDKSNSFNISTTASMVIAACGIKVAKHGNRAASSKSGAADCLEALGVNIDQDPELAVRLLNDVGICFLFAQRYHTSMKYVGSIRKELGIRTVFNILGPLTNPAKPTLFMLGVYDEYLVEPLAHVLADLGVKSGIVVYGQDCLDEVSISAKTTACKFWRNDNGEVEFYSFIIDPEQLGFSLASKEEIKGGTPEENAAITKAILAGEKGPKRDCVVLNAACALYGANAVETLPEGVKRAIDAIDTGAAAAVLDRYANASNGK